MSSENQTVQPSRVQINSILIGLLLMLCFGDASSTQAQWTTSGNDVYKTNTAGNVGIGTTSPGAKLHVEQSTAGFGSTVVGTFFTPDTVNGGSRGIQILGTGVGTAGGDVAVGFAKNTSAPYAFYSSGGTGAANRLLTITDGGNVGIGTTTPDTRLDVSGDVRGTRGTFGYAAALPNYDLQVVSPAGADRSIFEAGVSGISNGFTVQYLSSTQKMRYGFIDGSVGIGTATPDPLYKLDVNGDVRISGNISAKYQDVAEWVDVTEQLPAGTVVVLDSTKSNHVTSSSVSYDTRVAGVVSTQPGLALGEKSDSKVLVATTGRVRVKVDATKGPIHIGDLLVTSDVPGVAMKSQPVNLGGVHIHRPGTLIGKALEPLEKGKGEILVLLSLQ
jgi:hypothetical protein